MRTDRHIGLVVGCMLAACAALAKDPPTLVTNGSFEKLARAPGVADTGGKRGSWTIKGGSMAPAGWTLSSYFGGTLTVRSEGAAEGRVRDLEMETAPDLWGQVNCGEKVQRSPESE